ncbi:ROK family transcriptional regulator [Neobacillus bataviensis]|uniref:ROK family transcriptional regulator n=1 Tax=Neobacillus bataviensis TaxID=220685 RepID=UPI001CBD34D3|nr:ROK family transcriptional regulator [Neobacillus bataviensis]
MLTGDAAYIKKINRSLILSKIIEHGRVSRSDLAKITGLNKATISVQAADLLAEKLIIETPKEHKNLGRNPIMLSIIQNAGFSLGIDLDKSTITFTLSDLSGRPISTETIALQTTDYNEVLLLLSKYIKDYKEKYANARYGLIGVVIGIHGIVNNDEIIYFAPHHQWRNKNLKVDLKNETGVNIFIENNANLCAFSEIVYKHHQSENLLSVSLYSGIGLGLMVNKELIKGYHGYAGEIGHMIVVPEGKLCRCGKKGCFEQYASEASFIRRLAEIKQMDAISYEELKDWINNRDSTTCHQIKQFIKILSVGLNNIINLYNPEIVVINSELLRLFPEAVFELKNHLNSSVGHYRELVISDFGKKACILGACAMAIKKFLEVPELNLSLADHR